MEDITNKVCEVCKNWKPLTKMSGRCMFIDRKLNYLFTGFNSSCRKGFELKKTE